MARIFITGSSEGLGFLAGKLLVEQGNEVVLHARSAERAQELKKIFPQCESVVIGDVSTIAGMKSIAEQVNALGSFNAVIHNVGVGDKETRVETIDGITKLFAINVVTPYVLTALINRPERLIYISSGMHLGGDGNLDDLQWKNKRWNSSQAYSDSKLHDLILTLAFSRIFAESFVNAVDPGWVPTRMGGSGAPDDLIKGAMTQAWLATSNDSEATVTGAYFHHQKKRPLHSSALIPEIQGELLKYLESITNIKSYKK